MSLAWLRSGVVLLAVWAAGCGGSTRNEEARRFTGGAVKMGVVSGFVVDDETGAPIASAQVVVGGTAVRSQPNGSFTASAPAGRARVEVRVDGFLQSAREVAVGNVALALPFKLARKANPFMIDSRGGTFGRDATLTVEPNAFTSATPVSMTYLGRARVAATTAAPQFIDSDRIPRRVVATVDLDTPATPAMPVRVRVPVPSDATMASVRGFAKENDGRWTSLMMPRSVSGGFAEFSLSGSASFGVTVDVRVADGRQIGYLVTEGGDAGMTTGQVVMGGTMIATASRSAALVDPQGSRVELAPATRVRVEVPAPEVNAGDSARIGSFAGRAALANGAARILVPAGASEFVKLVMETPATTLEVRGTAFSITTCETPSGFVDILEVVEGSVDAVFGGATGRVGAGESATFCTRCTAGAPPQCGILDAGAPALDALVVATDVALPPADLAVPPADTMAPLPVDAVIVPPVDAGVMPDTAVATPDVAVPVDTAPPPPDVAPPPPDTAVVVTPDAAPPEPDTAPPSPDVGEDTAPVPADMAVLIEDTAPPPPDLAAAALSISPMMESYGTVELGTTSKITTFTVTNTGDEPTGPPSVTTTSPFGIVTNTCLNSLAAKGSCAVSVRFDPANEGMHTGSLTVSASPGGMVTAVLSGYGATAPMLEIMPVSQYLGTVAPGSMGTQHTFLVKNAGGVQSGIPSASIVGTSMSEFTLTHDGCMGPLGSGETCQLGVTFSPTGSPGARTAQLRVDANRGGTVFATMNGNVSYIEIMPAQADFGSTMPGTPTAQMAFTVRHTGPANSPELVVNIALGGNDGPDFKIEGHTCANRLVHAATCTVNVAFQPRNTGPKSATLDVTGTTYPTGGNGGTSRSILTGTGL